MGTVPSDMQQAYTSGPVEGHRPAGNPVSPAEARASIVAIDDVDIVQAQPQQQAEGVVVIVVMDNDGSGRPVVVAMVLLSMTAAMVVMAVGRPSVPLAYPLEVVVPVAAAVPGFTRIAPVQAVTIAVLDCAALVVLR
jgi:hypothetical protein